MPDTVSMLFAGPGDGVIANEGFGGGAAAVVVVLRGVVVGTAVVVNATLGTVVVEA